MCIHIHNTFTFQDVIADCKDNEEATKYKMAMVHIS